MKGKLSHIALTGCSVLALTMGVAIPATAADSEQGYRYASSCTIGSENRPAVTWLAKGSTILITPPGYSGHPNDPFVYSSPNAYTGTTNGGLVAGGRWVVYSTNDVNQSQTYGSCTF